MKKKAFEKQKRMNVFKMSIEEIDQTNHNIKHDMKKITLRNNHLSPLNLSPDGQGRNHKNTSSNNNNCKKIQAHVNTLTSPLFQDNSINTNANSNSYIIKGTTIINSQQHISNFTDCVINQLERSISKEKNQRRDCSFDYAIVRKNKLLLPITSIDQVKNMRLCEKSLLPNEKNYFVSEKNFKLIIDALSQKEYHIRNLKVLLDLAKSDLKNSNNSLAFNSNEIENKTKQIEHLLIDNNQLNTKYDDFMFLYNKMLSVHNRIVALVSFIHDNCNKGSINSNCEICRMINDKIEELELSGIIKLLTKEQFAQLNTNTNTTINGCLSLDRNEELCIEYRKKINDAQELLSVYEKIDKNQMDNLSEIAKDMLKTKQRLKELNDLNERLEKENTYLRISYQNIYCENEGKNRKNQNQILLLSKKVDEQNRTLSNLQNENINLASESKEARESLMKHLKDQSAKDNNMNELENKVCLLSETLKEKDSIITELKNRIKELEVKNTINDSLMKNSNNSLMGNKKKEDPTVVMYEDIMNKLNKSSDCIIENVNGNINTSPNSNKKKKDKMRNNEKSTILLGEKERKKEMKKDLEIKMLKDKVDSLEKEEKNLYFEGENEEIGVNGVVYISDLFMHLYNQAKVIEDCLK